jgi:type IV pilus assembly protein PilA
MQPGYQPPQPKKSFPVWAIILIVVAGLGVVLVGTLAALGIYGTRRYIASAKTAEAKNSIGAIARAARNAYEYEQEDGGHKLCRSAVPVPSKVQAGTKYMPSSSADFNTGDEKTGWRCLKFAMQEPIYYQYHYNQGAGYLGKTATPGPTGFEAAARGDIDGNGTTSLFAMTGAVAGSEVRLSTTIEIENEFE